MIVGLGRVAMLVAVLSPVTAAAQAPADLPGAIASRIRAHAVVCTANYAVGASIQPLPLLWLGRDHLGGARLIRRAGADGMRAYEFIVGSDPARAPRRINRWGYLAEEVHRDGRGSLVGFIKQSDEQSLAEASAAATREVVAGRFPFKVYAGRLERDRAFAGDAIVSATQDFTFHEFDSVLALVAPRAIHLEPKPISTGTRTGLLTTVHELLNDSAAARRANRADPTIGRRLAYMFNNTTYQLVVKSTVLKRNQVIGGQRYERLIRARIDGLQPGTDKKMDFDVWYPVDGPLAGMVVKAIVQPRWWFRFAMTLQNATDCAA